MAQVIEGGPGKPTAAPVKLRAALHIHAYFTGQLEDVVTRLNGNANLPDLFVSVANEAGERSARHQLSGYRGDVVAVEIVPNTGRDIGPLLSCFGPKLVKEYDVVGHVHTKKSSHVENSKMIETWVDFTHSGVLGGKKSGPMVDRILNAMEHDDRIGIVYPDDPHIIGWTENTHPARKLAQQMNLGPLPDVFNFPVGTMFWMRSEAFKPFVDLGLTWCDYPSEPIPIDGTMLHALERLFGVVPQMQGWKTAVTHTAGISR